MKRLLLVGAGHAHAQVLKDWIATPLPGVELVLVSPSALAPYSGMVPGWLAGVYGYDEICIDFEALARAARARLVIDALVGLDPDRRVVRLANGTLLGYDVLSLNVGSTLSVPAPSGAARVLALRPLGDLRAAWDALLGEWALRPTGAPQNVVAVGGGAAGVETILAVLARLRSMQPQAAVHGRLVTRSASLLQGLAPAAVRAAQAALGGAGVTVQLGEEFDAAEAGTDERSSELLLWATGAEAHAWQHACGLAVSTAGFIRVDARLRSVSHPQVHAVGDCAQWALPLPKAGVHAVRMGPVLSRNLRAALGAGPVLTYRPQSRVLALLSTADGSAVASWGPWSVHGRWVWRWKDWIDRRFLRRFAVVNEPTSAHTGSEMAPSKSHPNPQRAPQ